MSSVLSNQTPPSYGFGRCGFGFFGPRIAFCATGALWGRATPFFYHVSVHLSSVLGRTELCHEVWTPGPQKNPKSSAMKTPPLGTARDEHTTAWHCSREREPKTQIFAENRRFLQIHPFSGNKHLGESKVLVFVWV